MLPNEHVINVTVPSSTDIAPPYCVKYVSKKKKLASLAGKRDNNALKTFLGILSTAPLLDRLTAPYYKC